jgi:hypothetical protein
MPLDRSSEGFDWNADAVLFSMMDGQTRTIFRIDRDALLSRAAADGVDHTGGLGELFVRYRTLIEQIARDKFDSGDPAREILTTDLRLD